MVGSTSTVAASIIKPELEVNVPPRFAVHGVVAMPFVQMLLSGKSKAGSTPTLNVAIITSVAVHPGTDTVQVNSKKPGELAKATVVGSVGSMKLTSEGPDHVPMPLAPNWMDVSHVLRSGPALLLQFRVMPSQVQDEFHVSLIVLSFPSLHGVPGKALPPLTPSQSKLVGVPMH